jgi:ABC-2 type transport system ATP-binding protein
VRTDEAIYDPAWTVEQVGLEDLVLAYMGQAAADAGEGGQAPGARR